MLNRFSANRAIGKKVKDKEARGIIIHNLEELVGIIVHNLPKDYKPGPDTLQDLKSIIIHN